MELGGKVLNPFNVSPGFLRKVPSHVLILSWVSSLSADPRLRPGDTPRTCIVGCHCQSTDLLLIGASYGVETFIQWSIRRERLRQFFQIVHPEANVLQWIEGIIGLLWIKLFKLFFPSRICQLKESEA
jgi:hypothetical protein